MKKIFTLLLIFFCFSPILYAQTVDTIDCDKPDRDTIELESLPWFGNNAYLESFLDSIGYPAPNTAARIIGPDRVRYHIPIKFWVYRSSAGTGGPSILDLRNYIDNLNRFYNLDNNTLIGFYMRCDIGYINDDSHVSVESDGEARGLLQDHKERGCINIHVANTLSESASGIHYRARFFGVDGIFLARATYVNGSLNGTIAHEVGHYLELDHTHQYSDKGKCRKESISRTRTWPFISFCPFGGGGPSSQKICEASGDLLSDTPADPDLTNNLFNATGACLFNQQGSYNTARDPWNDSYVNPPAGSPRPDPRNLLSYNRDRSCRNFFSRLQIAVMLYSIERGKSKNNKSAWKDARAEYDEYEMDNESAIARNIILNEKQERNFHQQYVETGPVWTQCDVDWARFVAPCSSNFEVFTSAMTGRTNANTRLTLFDNNLVQLAQNDNISGTNLYSSIAFNFIAGRTYFIRVENMANLVTGYYNLQVGRFAVAGNANMCSPTTYTFQNLPTGATITWSAVPTGVVNFNPAGPTTNPITNVTANANASITINATINSCGAPFVVSLPVVVGPVITGYYTISSNYHQPIQRPLYANNSPIWLPANQYFGVTATITNPNPVGPTWTRAASSYAFNWSTSGVILNFSGTSGTTAYSQRNGTFNFTANTGCGTTTTTFTWPVIVQSGSFRVSMSPNPTRNNLVVSILDEAEKIAGGNFAETITMSLQDLSGLVTVKRWEFKNLQKSFNLNVSGVRKGYYLLTIQKGKLQQTRQVLIE